MLKRDFIPITIAILMVIISYAVALTSDFLLNIKHHIGVVILLVVVISYFKKTKYYHLLYIAFSVLGLIGVIDILYSSISISIGFISFNPVFLGLLIIIFSTDKKFSNKVFPPKSKQEEDKNDETLVKSFEKRFYNKSKAELQEIINDNRYSKEARLAAKKLIDSQQKSF